MLKENLKDAGEIIQNILRQPLSVPGIPTEMSLLQAAKEYHPSHGSDSPLSRILQAFRDYPGPTERLITELDIILSDLHQAH